MKTLRKKLLFIGFFILLVYSTTAFAQADTEVIISDTDNLTGGYFILYRREISYFDTNVTVVLNSSEPIEFGVCDDGDLEDWNEGGDYPIWYYNSEDVFTRTMHFILDDGDYNFCLLNWGVNTANYTLTVTITYDIANTPTSSIFSGSIIWYIIIIVVIIVALMGIFRFMRSRRRKTQQQYSQASQYDSRQIYTPYQSSTYEQPSYASQTPTPLKPLETKVCQNCGADMEGDAVFCTNCGSKI